jgi:signal transduction histidine kinase
VTALTVAQSALWWVVGPEPRAWIIEVLFLLLFGAIFQRALARTHGASAGELNWKALAAFGLLGVFNASLHGLQLLQEGIEVPHPPVATLLLWPAAMGLLLYAFVSGAARKPGRLARILDGVVFGMAAYLGLWMWVVKPLLVGPSLDPLLMLGVHLTFLTACTTLGVALHVWVERASPLYSPIGLLALGILLLTLFLPSWVGLLLSNQFRYAHPIRLAFVPGFLALYLATQAPWPLQAAKPHEGLRLALPYLPTTVVFLGFLFHYLPRQADRDATGLGLLGALAILVLMRQALTLRQLFHLNRDLEEKVDARTRELTRSQGLLMDTQQKNLVATLGAGITHDLNNLLGAAMGNLDLLRLKIGPLPESRELDGLEKALERAGNLSKSLMGLAREGPGPARRFDLLAHMEELHPLLRAMVPRNLNLAWEPGEGSLELHANPGQVDQVLVNLVSNAKDATPPGGRITLRARAEGAVALIEVADTGPGIPDHVMQRLFEPFVTTKPAGKGTGLGLSSVRAVVEHLGGTIEVQSSPAMGTTFTLRLPLATEGRPAPLVG